MTTPPAPDLIRLSYDRMRVGQLVSRYRRRAAQERLRLFRQYLQVSVVSATPLLAEIVAEQGVDLRGCLFRLRPPFGWPDCPRPSAWASVAQILGRRGRRSMGDLGVHDPSHSILVRDRDHPLGPLILRIVDDGLEVTTGIGDVIVRTGGGCLQLILRYELPGTIELAAVGRPASCLVGHPWFADGGWTIEGVSRSRRAGSVRTTVSIGTGQVPFVMPWAHLLAGRL